mmetsp:Transcript_3467/g.11353  ORF Transcript_3467/g.11353 Transcript_3467/m.11353 type:complete len:136 (-) Transcript_3467:905-1312(-)
MSHAVMNRVSRRNIPQPVYYGKRAAASALILDEAAAPDENMAPATPGYETGSEVTMLCQDGTCNEWRPAVVLKEKDGKVQVTTAGGDSSHSEWLPLKSARLRVKDSLSNYKDNRDGTFSFPAVAGATAHMGTSKV